MMIRARALTKRYGRTVAVNAIDFTVEPGVVTGFLGPNGAGKSTTMRAVFGGGLYFAALSLFGLALGMLMRHTAAAVTVGLATLFVVGSLVALIPGTTGEWLTKLVPGNAGSVVAMVEPLARTCSTHGSGSGCSPVRRLCCSAWRAGCSPAGTPESTGDSHGFVDDGGVR